ncbi:dTMP kinase [Patescibacteria group bacterium]|nr:dTMP kinase [Patescibacteria group bacterium]
MRKNPYAGKLIVFEGIEGAGGETQSELLFDFFKEQGKLVKKLSFPDNRGPIGELIHQFLHRKYDFSPRVQFLLYFSDFLKDKEKIERWQKEGEIIVSDRYFASTLAYQCAQKFSLSEALNIAEIFELPKPDLILYLKISPETGIQRKLKEKNNLDRHESNKQFIEKVANFYEKLIKNQIYTNWVVIDGERAIREVSEDVKLQLKFLYEKHRD